MYPFTPFLQGIQGSVSGAYWQLRGTWILLISGALTNSFAYILLHNWGSIQVIGFTDFDRQILIILEIIVVWE